MRAVEIVPSVIATATTMCSARSWRDPMRNATTAAASHSTSVSAPRHTEASSTNPPLPHSWATTPVQASRWRNAISMPSPAPIAASGGEPKWSSSWRMLPGS